MKLSIEIQYYIVLNRLLFELTISNVLLEWKCFFHGGRISVAEYVIAWKKKTHSRETSLFGHANMAALTSCENVLWPCLPAVDVYGFLFYCAFSSTWPAATTICGSERSCLRKQKVPIPHDWSGTNMAAISWFSKNYYGCYDVMWKRPIIRMPFHVHIKDSQYHIFENICY